jgi:hypothetical protein
MIKKTTTTGEHHEKKKMEEKIRLVCGGCDSALSPCDAGVGVGGRF